MKSKRHSLLAMCLGGMLAVLIGPDGTHGLWLSVRDILIGMVAGYLFYRPHVFTTLCIRVIGEMLHWVTERGLQSLEYIFTLTLIVWAIFIQIVIASFTLRYAITAWHPRMDLAAIHYEHLNTLSVMVKWCTSGGPIIAVLVSLLMIASPHRESIDVWKRMRDMLINPFCCLFLPALFTFVVVWLCAMAVDVVTAIHRNMSLIIMATAIIGAWVGGSHANAVRGCLLGALFGAFYSVWVIQVRKPRPSSVRLKQARS